ncbi:MAG: hypothetical protein JRN06_02005 [Nitrososphaerota archaeon]|nr:hypothetical protein [Nitrososphaerota archaeon]MDG7023371.1 hypothetical protein [Nitrososphaerota archaeon]
MLDTLGYGLVSIDVALYALLALQLLRSGQGRGLGETIGAEEAFALLGAEIRRSVPNVPPGFTWEEAIGEARKLEIDVDWPSVDKAVQRYECYRYGGEEEPVTGYEEIHRLARELRRAR